DQEQLALATLKGFHAGLPLRARRRPVEVLVADGLLVEPFAHQREKVDELAEHERAMAVDTELFYQREQCFDLGAVVRGLRENQARMATKPPQARDLGEDLELVLAFAVR